MIVVIADDHALVRESIADVVARLNYGDLPVEILHASNYAELKALRGEARKIDLVLFDYNMPGLDGVNSVRDIVETYAGIPAVVMSGSVDSATARACIDAGVAGFISKTVSLKSMRNALRVVLDGEKYIHSHVNSDSSVTAQSREARSESPAMPALTLREAQIIDLLIAGSTNKAIARALDFKEMTVKTHVRNIYRKLNAANRADAVRIVLEFRAKSGS